MSLRKNIISQLDKRGKNTSLKQLYLMFPEEKETTIRGRVYDSIGKGITKVGKGLYISSNAIIEQGNSLEIIDRMIDEQDKFEFIFLDIPYSSGGQKGGNRKLFDKPTITPDQFDQFVGKLTQLLKNDNSVIAFMFTSGKSSQKEFQKYYSAFTFSGLQQAEKIGTYTKLWSNGNRMNMGKYLMPKENIYFFSKSGNIQIDEIHFELCPNIKLYPTAKPFPMIKSLVNQLTKVGDWVFDPFGGSGMILKSCLELDRNCHIIDIDDVSVHEHLLKI